MTTLFTGATGFLGSRMLRQLLADEPARPITVLGRGSPDALHDRVRRAVSWAAGPALEEAALGRLRCVSADLSRPDLGLSAQENAQLAADTTELWHCAALLNLEGEPRALYRTNVLGTRALLHLADRAPLSRLVHVSTAYVAGNRTHGHLLEGELTEEYGFANAYEESKYTAERMVRAWAERTDVSTLVLRTGLLVDDRVAPADVPGQPLDVLTRAVDAFLEGALARLPQRPLPDGRQELTTPLHFRLQGDPDGELALLQGDYAALAAVRAAAAHRAPGLVTAHVTHPHNTPFHLFARAYEARYPGLHISLQPVVDHPTPDEKLAVQRCGDLMAASAHRRTFDRTNLLRLVAGLPDPEPVELDYLIRALGGGGVQPAGVLTGGGVAGG